MVHMECRDLLGHLAVMDVTEPKETWAARGRLDPRDHLVLKERKEILGSRVPPAIKESEGTKVTVELLGCLHMNLKECAWKKGDGRDSGEIYVSITLYLSKIFHSNNIITENNITEQHTLVNINMLTSSHMDYKRNYTERKQHHKLY